MLLERESSVSKRVSRLKILFQPEVYPSYSFFIVIVFNFLELREFLLSLGTLDVWSFRGVSEGGASGRHMSTFLAAEAKSLLGTLLSFFWGKFLWEFNRINVHGGGVFGGSGG